MDFIFMLTRDDRTIDDAEEIVDAVSDLGVRHIGFKDVGVPHAMLGRLVERIRRRGALSYLEVVSTTQDAVDASLATHTESTFKPSGMASKTLEEFKARRAAERMGLLPSRKQKVVERYEIDVDTATVTKLPLRIKTR
jgi:hypothetical protein